MDKYILTTFILFFCFSIIGCVSSEETGAGDRARTPVQILGTIDTTKRTARHEMHRDTVSKTKIDSQNVAVVKPNRTAPKFKSKQDTLRASVIIKPKSSTYSSIKIIRPENPVFTVQIGAFTQASNALRAQKKAKERFAEQPIFNNYVKSAKLYRVSVGRCEDKKDAFSLRDSIRDKYPKEYHQCWVNFLP